MAEPNQPSPAVVLLSGGLDSATTLAVATDQGYACHALSFDYGQRNRIELQAAQRVAKSLHAISHRWTKIDLRAFGGSALTDEIEVPKNRTQQQMGHGVPVTYVPARNTIFLSFALALAETLQASDIFIGVNAVDYSGYPDCRPVFIDAFQTMANLATRAAIQGTKLRVHAPLIDLTKPQIIQRGLDLGVDYSLTHSCYDPSEAGHACGQCDACLLRKQAFVSLGRRDPALKQG